MTEHNLHDERYHRYRRLLGYYLVWSSMMIVGMGSILFGLIAFAFSHTLGASFLSYGVLILIIFSSFYFIARSRYHRAKMAYRAKEYAKAQAKQQENPSSP
nr:hypothetical protein [Bacilli bacterium]